jgi:NADPH:quinone reductase-like Zn-dependent oxidoreductase
MRKVIVTKPGGPEVLQLREAPDPSPGPEEVVVRLIAANVNPTDLGARQGMFPPGFGIEGPPYVLGWDLAGEVIAAGDGINGRSVGDHVVGMIPWYRAQGRYGAYADPVLLRAEWLVALPDGLDPAAAATVPLNGLTAHQALDHLQLPEGARLLITGASGAVGSFAAQLAARRGIRVTAQAGTADEQWVQSLGVEHVLARDADLSSVEPFPYVLDAVPIGTAAFSAAADGATIVSTRAVDEDPGRRIHQQAMLIEWDADGLRTLIKDTAAGRLRTRIDRTVPLADAGEAHRLSAERGRHGKILLVP